MRTILVCLLGEVYYKTSWILQFFTLQYPHECLNFPLNITPFFTSVTIAVVVWIYPATPSCRLGSGGEDTVDGVMTTMTGLWALIGKFQKRISEFQPPDRDARMTIIAFQIHSTIFMQTRNGLQHGSGSD